MISARQGKTLAFGLELHTALARSMSPVYWPTLETVVLSASKIDVMVNFRWQQEWIRDLQKAGTMVWV